MKRLIITTALTTAMAGHVLADTTTDTGSASSATDAPEMSENLDALGERVREGAEDAAEATAETADSAADAISNTAQSAAETASDAGSAIVDTARDAGDAASDAAQRLVDRLQEATQQDDIAMASDLSTELTIDAPQIDREGWTAADLTLLPAEDMVGVRVYSPEDDRIGEIDMIVLDDDGNFTSALIGAGGFLEFGERDVLVSFDSLTLVRETDSGTLRAYVNSTHDAFVELPEYQSS